ncbi:hypothetical protein WA026_018800, partial [Henosepilachna vigintioctopunctata]
MRYLRSVKGCTLLDRIRNDDIRRELKIFNLCDRIREYRNCWKDHVQRMTDARLPKAILEVDDDDDLKLFEMG